MRSMYVMVLRNEKIHILGFIVPLIINMILVQDLAMESEVVEKMNIGIL